MRYEEGNEFTLPDCPEEGCVMRAHTVVRNIRTHWDGERSWETEDDEPERSVQT